MQPTLPTESVVLLRILDQMQVPVEATSIVVNVLTSAWKASVTLVTIGHAFTSLEYACATPAAAPTMVDMIVESVHLVIEGLTVIKSTFVQEDLPLA